MYFCSYVILKYIRLFLLTFFYLLKDVENIITHHSYLTQILTTFYGKNLFQINVYRQRRSALSDKIHMDGPGIHFIISKFLVKFISDTDVQYG